MTLAADLTAEPDTPPSYRHDLTRLKFHNAISNLYHLNTNENYE